MMTTTLFVSWVFLATASGWLEGSEGDYKPGAVSAWNVTGPDETTLSVPPERAVELAAFITESIQGADAKVMEDRVVVTKITTDRLLQALLAGSDGEADPLSAFDLDDSDVVALRAPEGGGSIRAADPEGRTLFAMPPEKQQIRARILSVTRSEFPRVTLKFKVERARKGRDTGDLRRGKAYTANVIFVGGPGEQIDFGEKANHPNLGAYFLKKGDRVYLHAVKTEKGNFKVDWIERK